jgi:hypothetical protein
MSAPKSPGSRAPFASLIRGLHLLGGGAGELMGRAFTSIGIVALVGALGWWQTFYGEVHRLLGATGPLPIECLYSMSPACRLVADAAELFGARSYHPLIFWAACGCLLIGLGLGPRGRVPRRRSRNRAKPPSRS